MIINSFKLTLNENNMKFDIIQSKNILNNIIIMIDSN